MKIKKKLFNFFILACLLGIVISCSSPNTSPAISTSRTTSASSNETAPSQPTKPAQPFEPADTIFYNGNIMTMEKGQPLVQAIAVRGKLIQAVGSDKEILAFQGSDTVVIDLQGKTLMPGFVDTHRHPEDRNLANFVDDQQMAVQNGITSLAYLYVDEGILATMKAMDDSG